MHNRGVEVAITDTRDQPPGLSPLREDLPDVALFLGGFPAAVFERAERIVLSPGVPLSTPEIAAAIGRGVPVSGDIDLFAEHVSAPVIGISGSNGKSTVTTLTAMMAEEAGLVVRAGGNLGTPALDLLGEVEPDLYVLELSSFQLEMVHCLLTRSAAVLNVSADHMDRYANLADYAAQKRRLYHRCEVMVVNLDDPWVARMREPGRQVVGFTLDDPGGDDAYGVREVDGDNWLCHGATELLAASSLRLVGRHNCANALAALALTGPFNLPLEPRLAALRKFPGLNHRMQWVAERDGIRWYNDSKATNVGACLAALDGLAGAQADARRVVLIAGGDGKGADFQPLRRAVSQCARGVVLIGRDGPGIETALGGAVPVVHAQDMVNAVQRAGELARPGDSVLLSPACASFDMFSGFEERGRVFCDAVRRVLG
jgi:UDP-N-acetylmuramoylalanine--D-glutamate ligase